MAFTFAACCYMIASILSWFLIFLAINLVKTFHALKTSLNPGPVVVCKKLNPFVLPEYITHFSVTLLFLCSGELLMFLLNFPLVVYHVCRYKNRPVLTKTGLYDWKTIWELDNVNYAFREAICKAVFYIIFILYYLYRLEYGLTYY